MTSSIDALCVYGGPIYQIAWYVQHQESLLLASATAEAAHRARIFEGRWQKGHDDVDFVLFDAESSTAADKREAVDYAFLEAPPPPRRAGESLEERQAVLKEWMVASYVAYNAQHFPETLKAASPSLFFEYDSVLSSIGEGTARTVQGVVVPATDGSGGSLVRFTIPLLLSLSEKTYQTLNNLAVLYCKASHGAWKSGYQLTKVEVDAHVEFRCIPKSTHVSVLSERVAVRLSDHTTGTPEDSFIPFLKSCLNLHHLPRFSTLQHGAGFLDYIPRLEKSVYRRVREPLHFMKLILGLTADFGDPMDVSVSCRALHASGVPPHAPPPPPLRKTATFCVVDKASMLSFTLGLHYHSGEELPTVEVTCNQYATLQHDGTLSHKVKYAKAASAMRKDDDGFVDVEELRMAIVHASLECMTKSMALV